MASDAFVLFERGFWQLGQVGMFGVLGGAAAVAAEAEVSRSRWKCTGIRVFKDSECEVCGELAGQVGESF